MFRDQRLPSADQTQSSASGVPCTCRARAVRRGRAAHADYSSSSVSPVFCDLSNPHLLTRIFQKNDLIYIY